MCTERLEFNKLADAIETWSSQTLTNFEAAEILTESQKPLIYGIALISTIDALLTISNHNTGRAFAAYVIGGVGILFVSNVASRATRGKDSVEISTHVGPLFSNLLRNLG